MAITFTPVTPANVAFGPLGNSAWTAGMQVGGLSATSGALLYSTDATTLAQSTGLIYDGTNLYVSGIDDSNSNLVVQFVATASAVNYFKLTNSATGSGGSNGVTIGTTGSDSTVDMRFDVKGAAARYEWAINGVEMMDYVDLGGGSFSLRNNSGGFSGGAISVGVVSAVISFNADSGLSRIAAGVLGIGTGGAGGVNGQLNLTTTLLTGTTYANRPGTPATGMVCNFTDSNTAVWGATIAGGGANNVMARYNGANWTVVGI